MAHLTLTLSSLAMGLRVFLSYGRDEYAAAGERIYELLTSRGHDVWFDRDRLAGGVDWEHSIEQGIDWVAEDPARGRVILVMTPHSVRRPDGYCLNELARSLQRQLVIVPVMLVEVEPPLSICRLQWLDMTTCVPLPDRQEAFDVEAEALLSALESGEVESSDLYGRLAKTLQPIAFDYELSSGLRDFTMRAWVVDTVDEWLNDRDGGPVLWISGGVGTGKTTVALWLAARRSEFAAWHFCRYGHPVKADARRCVMSVAYQLSTQLPDYADRLSQLDIKGLVDGGGAAGMLFDLLVLQPLSSVSPPDRTIVAILDGLDEATIDGRNELAVLISSFTGQPRWLRFLVTSRPEAPISTGLRGRRRLDLDAHERETQADLTAFVTRGLDGRVTAELRDVAAVAIVERAGGSFLYAHAVLDDIAFGRLAVGELSRLPPGLAGVYWRLFERQFPDIATYARRVRPVLELLASERAPLPLSLVAEILGWRAYDQQELLVSMGSLCVVDANHIQPFHASLVEWLTDANAAGHYWVDAAAGHRLLADAALTIDKAQIHPSRYLAENAAAHMTAAGRPTDAARVLGDVDYLEDRLELRSFDHDSRREARFGHRDDVRHLASQWPADADSELIERCVIQFAEIGWWVIGDRYDAPLGRTPRDRWELRWDEGAGLLTTAVDLVDDLAQLNARWIDLIPRVINYDKTSEITGNLKGLLSSRVLWVEGGSPAPYYHLRAAVSSVVAQWSDSSDPRLIAWVKRWTPVPSS